jgi:arsenate reductase
VRAGEAELAQAGLTAGSGDVALLAAMARHPILIERPIFISKTRAVVGRPPEAIAELLEDVTPPR